MAEPLPSGSSNPISFRDIHQHILQSNTTPTADSYATSLQRLSITMASASIVLETRDSIMAARYAINELWGATYPSSVIANAAIKRGASGASGVEDEFVDSETLNLSFTSNTSTAHTVGLYDSSNTLQGSTFTMTTNVGGNVNTDRTNLQLAEATNYYYKITKDTFNNVNSPLFTHWDAITGVTFSNSPTNAIFYIDSSDDETEVTISSNASVGTITGRSWTFSNASTGDSSARTPETSTATSPLVTYTGTGYFPVACISAGNPSSARNSNTTTNTQQVKILYNRQVVMTTFVGGTEINQGATKQIYGLSRGFSGNLIIGYDDNSDDTDMDLEDSVSTSVSTLFEQDGVVTSNITMNNPGTFFSKAYHSGYTGDGIVSSASITVAPTFTYSTTGNKTISVEGSQIFKVLSSPAPVGNTIAITVAQSNFSQTTTNYSTGITVEPTIYNGTYTITYDGNADYSQPNDQTDTLTVNPSVGTITVSPTSGYTTGDTSGSALTVAKYGVAPTIFTTNTPTIIGDTIGTYAWSADGTFTLTSGNTATLATISGKFADGGTNTITLTVHESTESSGTTNSNSVDVTLIEPTKSFNSIIAVINTNSTQLRVGDSYTVTSTVDYITRVKLQFREPPDTWINMSATTATGMGSDFKDEVVTPDITLTIDASDIQSAGLPMRLVDTDKTSLLIAVKNNNDDTSFTFADGLPITPSITSVSYGNEQVSVYWTNGLYNNGGNNIYVYDAVAAGSGDLLSSMPFSDSSSPAVHTESLTGTSRVARYFKVSGINESSEESALSAVSSAAYLYPELSFTPSANKSISVNTTTTFNFTAFGGYNFQGSIICSTTSIGNYIGITNTNNQTFTPLTANGTHTITFDATADFLQNIAAVTRTLTVSPTVSLITSSATGYTTVDTAGNALSVATHGVAPTTYTITPTVVGSTIAQYLWAPQTGWVFLNTSYDAATAGLIVGKITDGGPGNMQLSVYQQTDESGTSGTQAITITPIEPTKAFDGNVTITNTDQKLRRGVTYSTSFQCDYVKNVKLQILNSSNVYANITGTVATDIGGDFVDESITKNFTILNTAPLETDTLRGLKLVDTNYLSNTTTSVQNTAADIIFYIYDGLPLVPTNIAVTNDVGKCHVSWTDGAYNNTNKVRVYSDAGGNTLEEIFFDSNNDNAGTHTLSPDSGTSIISRWFKISGINQTEDPEVISSISDEAKIWPTLAFSKSGNVSLNVGSSGYFRFTAIHGYNFQGTIVCSDTDIGNYSSVADTDGREFDPGDANGVYTITFDAVANSEDSSILQSIEDRTSEFEVLPIANFTVIGTQSNSNSLYISPPVGSGLNPDGLDLNDDSAGASISTYFYSVTRDGTSIGTFNPTFSNGLNPISSATITSWGVGTYNVILTISGNGTSDNESKDNAFSISNYADQYIILAGTFNVSQNVRRGSSYTIAGTIGATPILAVKLIYEFQAANGSWGNGATVGTDIFSGTTGYQTYSYAISSTMPLSSGGNYNAFRITIGDNADNTPTDTGADMTIIDGYPVAPSITSVSNDVGDCTVNWSDGVYNNTNTVYVYDAVAAGSGDLIQTVTANGTSYDHILNPDSGPSIISRWFKVGGTNQNSEEEISLLSGEAKIWPTISFTPSTTATQTISVNGFKDFDFNVINGVSFSGSITSSPDIGSGTETAINQAIRMSPVLENKEYTITWNASAATEDGEILQSASETNITLKVNPIAAFTAVGTVSGNSTLYIIPPAGSGLSADSLDLNDNSTGANVTGYAWVVTNDSQSVSQFLFQSTDKFNPITAATLLSWYNAAGDSVVSYNVSLIISGVDSTTDIIEDSSNAFTISAYAAQIIVITGTWNTTGEIRRGTATTITATIGTTPILAVKAYREYMDDSANWYKRGGDISTDLFGSNTSGAVTVDWTIPSDQHLSDELMTGNWGSMRIVLENNTASSVTDHGAARLIIDGYPIAPSTVAAANGNGSSVVTWSGGAFQGGGFKVLAYQTNGTYISISSSTISGYAYSNSTRDTMTRKFAIKCFNLNSFANSGIEDATSGFTGDVTIYPDLDDNHTISDTSIIIYANLVNTTGLTHTFTGNINPLDAAAFSGVTTPLSYSESSGIISLSNTTPAWDATTQATVTSLAVSPYVGDETVTLTVNSNSGQSDTSTCTVHVNFLPKTTNFNEINEPAIGYDQGANINVNVIWMGFEMGGSGDDHTWVVSVRDSGDNNTIVGPVDWLHSTVEGGPQSSGNESGTAVITAPTSNGTYRMVVDKKTGATSNTRFLSTGTFDVVGIDSAYLNHSYYMAQEPIDISFTTSWDAANYTNTQTYRDLVYWQSSGGIEEDTELYSSSNATTTRYEPPPSNAGGSTEGWMSYGSFVLLIQKPSGGSPDRGTVKTKLSKRPAAPTIADPTNIDSTSMDIVVSGDFRVATKVYFSYDNDDGYDFDQHITTTILNNQRNSTGSSTTSFTGLSPSVEYTFKCRLENDGPYATKTGVDSVEVQETTDSASTSWSSLPTNFVMSAGQGTSQTTTSEIDITLTNGGGNTSVSTSYGSGITVALSTTSNTSGFTTFSYIKTISHSSGQLWMKFKYYHPNSTEDRSVDVYISNSSVTYNDLDIRIITTGNGKGK